MLEVKNLEAGYGGAPVLTGVSFTVPEAGVVALLGANGAGKTTTMHALSGLLRPSAGEILFDGQRLDGRASHQIVARGLVQVPQGRQVFPDMTVRENLEVGAVARPERGWQAEGLSRVFDLFPRLAERAHQPAGTLSGGEQQMLAVGRALMSRPKLMIMDEPSLGLAPIIIRRLYQTIAGLAKEGLTILLAEQNIGIALSLSQQAYVLMNGRIVLGGDSESVRHDPALKQAYLGKT